MLPTLDLADVARIVELLDRATDPTTEAHLPERRRKFIDQLAALVDADVWMWSVTALNHEVPGDVMTTCFADAGWASPEEHQRVMEVLTSPDFNRSGLGDICRAMADGEQATYTNGEVFPPAESERLTAMWQATGFESFMLLVHPLNGNFSSNLGLHRRRGKPAFGPREKAIADTVYHHVEWLHHYGDNAAARETAIQLTPRERQTLILVLSGLSPKAIAERMKLSTHTVNDYLKHVYQRFGVKNRAELQAHFFVAMPASEGNDGASSDVSLASVTIR